MSLLLIGLGGCSSVDLVTILKKQRQNLHGITICVEGQRGEALPRPYETIHMTFVVSGKGLDKKKVSGICTNIFWEISAFGCAWW